VEEKIRKLLKHIADAQINLKSEFAMEQILSDILRIVRDDQTLSQTRIVEKENNVRLKIATKLMQGLLSNSRVDASNKESSIKYALEYADAMIKQEEK